jgi:hypothetical protein
MPGYLPEMEPVYFTRLEDAKRWILVAIGAHADEVSLCDDVQLAQELNELAADLNSEEAEFCSHEVGGLVYWAESRPMVEPNQKGSDKTR